MTLKDVMNIPRGSFLSLDERNRRVLVSRLVSAANKRVRRLVKAGIKITLSSYRKGKFSIKGKTGREFEDEYDRVVNFLSRKTSTIKGYREYQKLFERRASYALEEGYGIFEPTRGLPEGFEGVRFGEDWQMLDDILYNNRELLDKSARYDVHDKILDYMNDNGISDVSEVTDEQRAELKQIVDEYLQGSGSRVSMSGNR